MLCLGRDGGGTGTAVGVLAMGMGKGAAGSTYVLVGSEGPFCERGDLQIMVYSDLCYLFPEETEIFGGFVCLLRFSLQTWK